MDIDDFVMGEDLELAVLMGKIKSMSVEEASTELESFLTRFPLDTFIRYKIAIGFDAIGDANRCEMELAKALCIDPNNPGLSRALALRLWKREDRELATRILELGWARLQKGIPRAKRSEERVKYFAIPPWAEPVNAPRDTT